MKILIIADEIARKGPWYQIFEESSLNIETTESVFEANDLFLTGLAMGQNYALVVLHHTQLSDDAKKLMVYWRVQDSSLAVLMIGPEKDQTPDDLDDIGLLETIREHESKQVVGNHFRFLLQRIRNRQLLGIKIQILEEYAQLSDSALALSKALSKIVQESSIRAAAFVRFTDHPDEPILQITDSLELTDQIWLDELCENPDDSLATLLVERRMTVQDGHFLFPIISSHGWEGVLVFIVEEDAHIHTTDLESLSKTIHTLLERVRVNDDLQRKIGEKSTYFSLLSDTVQNSLKECAQKMELLRMILKDKQSLSMARLAENQITRSSLLLSDIIELGRIDDGLMVLLSQPVNLYEVLSQAMAKTMQTAEIAGISIDLDVGDNEELTLDADLKKMQQVFYNLLLFLLGKVERGGTIKIRFHEGSRGNVIIQLRAPTLSVDQLSLQRLFDRPEASFLLDENNVSLYICKKFIQAHEGNISAESDSPTGFTFLVQLKTQI